MKTEFLTRRKLGCGGMLLASIALVGFAHVPIPREIASFLIIEDSLAPAAAIVALGGETRHFGRWKQRNFIVLGGRHGLSLCGTSTTRTRT